MKKKNFHIHYSFFFALRFSLNFSETCVALNFINRARSSFKLYSSLAHAGYLVTGSGFTLKLVIPRPELHSHVTFHAEDLKGRLSILLNREPSISVPAVEDCSAFADVLVTSQQGNDKRSFRKLTAIMVL